MKSLTALVAAAFLLIAGTLNAQTVLKADKAHSKVNFSVTHMLISEVTGTFKDFDVTVTKPSDADFSGSTVEATIKTASVSTDNDRRDDHLRSNDFFNADSFPQITFKSTSFEKTGDDTYKITGNLTIRDVTKQVVLDAKMLGSVDAFGGKRYGFKATTTVNRFDYNVKWDRTLDAGGLIVSKEVNVTLLCELGVPPKDGPRQPKDGPPRPKK
jgi:polyisoprenoid-binding protein YceI